MSQQSPICRYASILVSVDATPMCDARIKLAADLSRRSEGRLIGCAAQPIVAPLYFEAVGAGVATFTEIEELRVADDLAKAKGRFSGIVGGLSEVEWRQNVGLITDFLVQQAREADLVVANRLFENDDLSPELDVDAGDLLMRAGRPILFVPPGIDRLSAERIIIGWNDTREARRAIADSMPLLLRASEVTVLSIGNADWGASNVAGYLACHGIAALAVEQKASQDDPAEDLLRFAQTHGADLIVCGGYGHSRVREWILSGVTLSLLDRAPLCCLMTH